MNWLAARHATSHWLLVGVAAATALVEVLNWQQTSTYWRSWASLIEGTGGAWVVVLPLAAAGGAAAAELVRRNHELTDGLPYGRRSILAAAALAGIAAAMVHLAFLVAAVSWGQLHDIPGKPWLWGVFALPVALVGASFLGAWVVRLGLGPSSPLAAAALMVVLMYVLRNVSKPLVDFGGVSVVMIGLKPNATFVALQTSWTMAATVALASLATRGREAVHSWAGRGAVAAALLAGVGFTTVAPMPFVNGAVEWRCESAKVRVCVAAEYSHSLSAYSAAINELVDHVAKVGIPVTPTYRQAVGVRAGAGSFNVDSQVSISQLAFDFVQFASHCSTSWDTGDLDRADVVARWITEASGASYPGPPSKPVTLLQAQAAWVSVGCER